MKAKPDRVFPFEFIHNSSNGACASIVFYQFVKSCGTVTYEDIKILTKTLKLTEIEYYLELMEPELKKIWNMIKNDSLTIYDLPTGDNLWQFSQHISCLKIFGESMYGLMSYFCRILLLLHSGIWVQELVGDEISHLRTNVKANFEFRKAYELMMIKHTKVIPYVNYMLWVNENGVVEPDMHVVMLYRIIQKDENGVVNMYWSLYNSNEDGPVDYPGYEMLFTIEDRL